jgi:hypothetical protein
VFLANLFSAILGGFLAILCLVALGETFNIFISKDGTPFWVVFLMIVAVVVPCFILSVFLEGAYLRDRAKESSDRAFWLSVTRAHCYSYLLLVGLDCLWISAKIW